MSGGWRTYTDQDPEPAGVSIVRDSSGTVSYHDSPEWRRTVGTISTPGVWQGWKGGERVTATWPQLVKGWGPVTGKNATTAKTADTPVEPGVPAAAAGAWPWWTSGVAS